MVSTILIIYQPHVAGPPSSLKAGVAMACRLQDRGGTEQKIAGTFAKARAARAFLVFDEADSLLLDRAAAIRGWEISQVNEMLTWMESHALPFACTTNLAERLDRASLRRFLVKLRFDWLTTAQARLPFREFYAVYVPAALDELRMLTPADFAPASDSPWRFE